MTEEVKKEEAPKAEESPKAEQKPAETKFEAHVSKFKHRVVDDIMKLMKEYPIVGAVNMENMPAASLQKMKNQLRDQVVMFMTKRRVMKHAFEKIASEKKDIEKLVPFLKGMPALMFTKENPFKVYKTIKQNKSPAPAKAGQTAPKDIVISAGPTPFAPGPVIGELSSIGLKTEVKEGKIHIKEDAVVVKEGEVIDDNTAGLLLRLGIEPMEVGLDLVAVYEDGVVYDNKILDIDEEEFMKSLQDAARWAFNLAVEAGHFTVETVNVLVPKAFSEAKAIALESMFMTDETKEDILAKAERQANSLKTEAKIPDAPAAEKTEKPPKTEEKKEEGGDEDSKSSQSSSEAGTKPAAKEEKAETKANAEGAPKEEKPATPPVSEKKAEEGGEKAVGPAAEKAVEKKEAPVEEKKEDVPVPKEPESPKTEEKKEEGGAEEAPADEKKEEPKAEESPKAEQKPAETEKKVSEEKIEKEEDEIAEDLKEIKEDIKEEEAHPDPEKVEKIEKEVEEVEDKIEKVDKEKKEMPSTEKIITKAIEKNGEASEKKPAEGEKEIAPEKKQAAEEGEKLFEQLKKEGTLRDIDKKEEQKPFGPKTPREIIEEAHKKMGEKKGKDVPSAHELTKKQKK